MKRFLHRGYFIEAFKQLRTPGIVTACVLMLYHLILLFTNVSMRITNTLPTFPNQSSLAMFMMAYVYIAGLILTFIGFNWLNKRAASDFYHALPIKRSQIYWSTVLAIALWLAIGLTAYALVLVALYLFTGMPFNAFSFLCVYLNMLIGVIQIVGIVSLSCALSGTRFVNLFSAFVILFAPRALLMVLAGFIYMKAPYIPILKSCFLFNPTYNLFATPYMTLVGVISTDVLTFSNVGAMVYSLLHACLLAFLGCVAFRRRPSESAGMPMRSRFIQGVVRTAFGLPLLLILAFLLLRNNATVSLTVILIVFAFTVYCLYELISTKSAKRMVKSMPLFSICVGIAALYLFVPSLIAKASSAIVADETNITSFELAEYGTEYDDLLRQSVRIDDPQGIKIVADAYRRTVEPHDSYIGEGTTVRIHRKGGLDIVRKLVFKTYQSNQLLRMLEENDAYRTGISKFPEGARYFCVPGLTFAESRELAALFAEEYNALSDRDRAITDANANTSVILEHRFSRTCFVLLVRGSRGVQNYSERYTVTDLTPKTAQRYAELLYAKYDARAKEPIDNAVSWMETREGEVDYIRIGSNLFIDLHDTVSNWLDLDLLPVESDPEYYEILQILKGAEPCDNAEEGVIVTFGYYGDYDYDALSGNAVVGSFVTGTTPSCICLKLDDGQLSRIRELMNQHNDRIMQYAGM